MACHEHIYEQAEVAGDGSRAEHSISDGRI